MGQNNKSNRKKSQNKKKKSAATSNGFSFRKVDGGTIYSVPQAVARHNNRIFHLAKLYNGTDADEGGQLLTDEEFDSMEKIFRALSYMSHDMPGELNLRLRSFDVVTDDGDIITWSPTREGATRIIEDLTAMSKEDEDDGAFDDLTDGGGPLETEELSIEASIDEMTVASGFLMNDVFKELAEESDEDLGSMFLYTLERFSQVLRECTGRVVVSVTNADGRVSHVGRVAAVRSNGRLQVDLLPLSADDAVFIAETWVENGEFIARPEETSVSGKTPRELIAYLTKDLGVNDGDLVFNVTREELAALAPSFDPAGKTGAMSLAVTLGRYVSEDGEPVRSTLVLSNLLNDQVLYRREFWENEGTNEENPEDALSEAAYELEGMIAFAGLEAVTYRSQIMEIPLEASGDPSLGNSSSRRDVHFYNFFQLTGEQVRATIQGKKRKAGPSAHDSFGGRSFDAESDSLSPGHEPGRRKKTPRSLH